MEQSRSNGLEQTGMAKLILLDSQGDPQLFALTGTSVTLGRSPECQIRFDSNQYGSVSRHHATLKAFGEPERWQICDENSANGTYLNGEAIQGCMTLQPGDRIMLSQNGPQLQFEVQDTAQNPYKRVSSVPEVSTPVEVNPLGENSVPRSVPNTESNPSLSQLIPVISTRKSFKTFWTKGYILPGILTVLLVVYLFFSRGNLDLFIIGLGTYLGAIGYSFIYRLCGKLKPWWEIAAAILSIMLLLTMPIFLDLYLFFFRVILPGNVSQEFNSFFDLFIAHFFGAGLSEELLKAIPVFLLMAIGNRIRSRKGTMRFAGVKEPLDGIVLAAASGLGFTLVETLLQYVPAEIDRVANLLGGSNDAIQAGQLLAVQLLVPRIIGSLAGHMAYSGYFGYFIGLSVLFPQRKWLILGIGYLTSSFLHALWNASGGTLGPIVLALAGILAYVFLIAAILKAREISPTRSQNFATRIAPSEGPPS